MLWNKDKLYRKEPFNRESELEEAILEVARPLLGKNRIYLDIKKRIGTGKTKNIPDGYLIDLTSKKDPKLYVVENELAQHDPLKHIAVQILEFSLSFEDSPHRVKGVVKSALTGDPVAWKECEKYAMDNGLENVDVLLEKMIYGEHSFNALVIIDEVPDELETVLISRFRFPVEILSISRYRDNEGDRLYEFVPFLDDVEAPHEQQRALPPLDPAELDTIVVPARDEGFQEVFLGETEGFGLTEEVVLP